MKFSFKCRKSVKGRLEEAMWYDERDKDFTLGKIPPHVSALLLSSKWLNSAEFGFLICAVRIAKTKQKGIKKEENPNLPHTAIKGLNQIKYVKTPVT